MIPWYTYMYLQEVGIIFIFFLGTIRLILHSEIYFHIIEHPKTCAYVLNKQFKKAIFIYFMHNLGSS